MYASVKPPRTRGSARDRSFFARNSRQIVFRSGNFHSLKLLRWKEKKIFLVRLVDAELLLKWVFRYSCASTCKYNSSTSWALSRMRTRLRTSPKEENETKDHVSDCARRSIVYDVLVRLTVPRMFFGILIRLQEDQGEWSRKVEQWDTWIRRACIDS